MQRSTTEGCARLERTLLGYESLSEVSLYGESEDPAKMTHENGSFQSRLRLLRSTQNESKLSSAVLLLCVTTTHRASHDVHGMMKNVHCRHASGGHALANRECDTIRIDCMNILSPTCSSAAAVPATACRAASSRAHMRRLIERASRAAMRCDTQMAHFELH